MSDERQVPFFCPYCGDESLRPAAPDAGTWTCGSCALSFTLKLRAGSGASQ
jgi:transcription elongation factor Elf1